MRSSKGSTCGTQPHLLKLQEKIRQTKLFMAQPTICIHANLIIEDSWQDVRYSRPEYECIPGYD
jgi:hypothetical protein